MASQERSPSQESVREAPYVGDTRTYSDFIMYMVKTGRFQHNNLLDSGHRKGVLNLVQSERVVKLTLERRLSPINVAFTAGGKKQLVYLIALVRAELESEELDNLVEVMNDYIEDMPIVERERAVIGLIHSMSSRVAPGIRYLPIHWYPANAGPMPESMYDDSHRKVDGTGLPIVPSDEEVLAISQGKENGKRNSKDIPMPSTSAVLSDASTDSGRGPGTYKKKPKKSVPEKIDWGTDKPSTSTANESEEATALEAEPQSTEFDIPSDAFLDEPGNQSDQASTSGSAARDRDSGVSQQNMQAEMARLLQGFNELKEAFNAMKAEKTSQTGKAPAAPAAAAAAPGKSRDTTPAYYNPAEDDLVPYFPINKYTKAMDWVMQQPVVHKFLQYETMREVYKTHPVFKPESDIVLGAYMDYVASVRLQTHFGKATTRVSKADYGRFPMPMAFLKVAQDELKTLGKQRTPYAKSVADFIKDRCNNLRRTHVIGSEFIKGTETLQEMAHRMMAERLDFVQEHAWIFDKMPKVNWSYDIELKKTRKLVAGQRKKDDPSFDGNAEPFPEDIELLIFPDMDKGRVLESMDEAKRIVAALEESGVSKPMFPRPVWDNIKAIVYPSAEELAMAKKLAEEKETTKKARNVRRREVYKAKHASQVTDSDAEDDEDDLDLDDPMATGETPQQSTHGKTSATETLPGEPSAKKSREETLRDIMGSISDISSTSSSDKQPKVAYNVNQEGTMIFTAEQDEPQQQEEEQATGKPVPSGGSKTVDTPTGPMATGTILNQAIATGVVTDQDEVMVAADLSANVSNQYSVIVQSPGQSEPTVVSGGSTTQQTFKETLTKPPEKSAIQRYEDMEDTMLDSAVMEGRSSSSSSSEEQTPKADKASKRPMEASGGVAMVMEPNNDKQDNQFKNPNSVLAKRETRSSAQREAKGKAKSKGKGKGSKLSRK